MTCYGETFGGTVCELPEGHDGHHLITFPEGGFLSWTDESMAEFARIAAERALEQGR
jgi:hypothetical protein